ncbi:MAG: AAA family ATPase [Oscillospiraceae bacterium]
MGKQYTSLDLRTVDRRRLFVVDRQAHHYSGFNMGAGENAIFTILIELFSAGEGALLVIDEIELGLHEEAQKAFIEELKKICKERHCQIICSTHSEQYLMHCRRQEESLLKLIPTRPLLQRGYLRHTQLESFLEGNKRNNCFGGRPDGRKYRPRISSVSAKAQSAYCADWV